MKRSKSLFTPPTDVRTRLNHLPFSRSEAIALRSPDHLLASPHATEDDRSTLANLKRMTGFSILLGLLVIAVVAAGVFAGGVGH
jgi:hypothetical protein